MSMNRVFILGRLGRDPELRYTQSNRAMVTMNIATTEGWFDKEANERKESTEWHRVVVWGRTAENCEKFLKKGREVLIEGRLQTREWQDKNNNRRWTTEIVANRVQFIGGRGDAAPSGSEQPPPPAEPPAGMDDFTDDDIPF